MCFLLNLHMYIWLFQKQPRQPKTIAVQWPVIGFNFQNVAFALFKHIVCQWHDLQVTPRPQEKTRARIRVGAVRMSKQVVPHSVTTLREFFGRSASNAHPETPKGKCEKEKKNLAKKKTTKKPEPVSERCSKWHRLSRNAKIKKKWNNKQWKIHGHKKSSNCVKYWVPTLARVGCPHVCDSDNNNNNGDLTAPWLRLVAMRSAFSLKKTRPPPQKKEEKKKKKEKEKQWTTHQKSNHVTH